MHTDPRALTLPGIIDLSVQAKHIACETRAARQSGVHTICLTPDSTDPVMDKAAVVDDAKVKAKRPVATG